MASGNSPRRRNWLCNPGEHDELKRYEDIFQATLAFNAPPFKNGEQFDWQRAPKTAMLKDYAKTAHMIGWPAPPDRKAEQARSEWIVPNMFTYYCTGESHWTRRYRGVKPSYSASTPPRRKLSPLLQW